MGIRNLSGATTSPSSFTMATIDSPHVILHDMERSSTPTSERSGSGKELLDTSEIVVEDLSDAFKNLSVDISKAASMIGPKRTSEDPSIQLCKKESLPFYFNMNLSL